MFQVGGQRGSLRKKDVNKKNKREEEEPAAEARERVTLSEQSRRDKKAQKSTDASAERETRRSKNRKKSEDDFCSDKAQKEKDDVKKAEMINNVEKVIEEEKVIPERSKQKDLDQAGKSTQTSYTEAANRAKAAQDDLQNARAIYVQMAADRQKWMMKMWEILRDLQTQIMEIMQSVALRRASTMDDIARKWGACLGDYKLD